jgi:hypothetical protein
VKSPTAARVKHSISDADVRKHSLRCGDIIKLVDHHVTSDGADGYSIKIFTALGDTISRIHDRAQFDCDICRYHFSVTSGTIWHNTHLPLRKWFMAIYLTVESKKGFSANQMKRVIGVSYKTARFLCHRIRAAMTEQDPTPLNGTVECDETFIGGRLRG